MDKQSAASELSQLTAQIDSLLRERIEFINEHMHLFAEFTIGEELTKGGFTRYRCVHHYQQTYGNGEDQRWFRTFNPGCDIVAIRADGTDDNCHDNTTRYGGCHPYRRKGT
jgi:hypothetical protein